MKKIRLGILGSSDVAFRRFLPALKDLEDYFDYAGVASRDITKTQRFIDTFGGCAYDNYDDLLDDEEINAVYLPLPPALHFEWAKKALLKGKHVFLEKPSTTSTKDTRELIALAKERKLGLYENYMFIHHGQLANIKKKITDGEIGKLLLIRANFSFPKRDGEDFRYNKPLGGGALLDCGGYPVRLAYELLGESVKITTSNLSYTDEFDVDVYGSASLINDNGLVCQIAFGIDNFYNCNLEIFANRGSIYAGRIFTAPPDMDVEINLLQNGKSNLINTGKSDQFKNSILHFFSCVNVEKIRQQSYIDLQIQADIIGRIQNNK